jgi:hypothetical protein
MAAFTHDNFATHFERQGETPKTRHGSERTRDYNQVLPEYKALL